MNFISPLGLWALCAIAAVLIIYFIRPKYKAKTVSGTFLWKMALRYGKTNSKREILQNLLLLLLQILVISLLAFTMSRPTVTYTVASGEKVIILDASVSMSASDEETSRFDRAVEEVRKLAEKKKEKDKLTLILANDKPEYLAYRTDSGVFVSSMASGLECGYTAADMDGAVKLAEAVLDENAGAEVILITDKDYEQPGYITVKNVAGSEWNAAVLDLKAELKSGYYVFTAQAAVYGADADIPVKLFVNGAYKKLTVAQFKDGEPLTLTWDDLKITAFDDVRVTLDVQDGLSEDNQLMYFNEEEVIKVQIVSSAPNFLSKILQSTGRCQVDTVPISGSVKTEGYDLYIFEGYAPQFMPTDGAVWMFNPLAVPKIYGFEDGGPMKVKANLQLPEEQSDAMESITKGVDANKITVSRYTEIKYLKDSDVKYDTVLKFNVGTAPAIIAGRSGRTNILVFSFDIHNSNLPLLIDFPILIDNALNYSVPPVTDKKIYETGETIKINAKPVTDKLILSHGENVSEYDDFPVEFKAREIGKYTVEQIRGEEKLSENGFFVRIAESESNFALKGGVLAESEYNGNNGEPEQETAEIATYIAALLLLVLTAEWGLSYRGQR